MSECTPCQSFAHTALALVGGLPYPDLARTGEGGAGEAAKRGLGARAWQHRVCAPPEGQVQGAWFAGPALALLQVLVQRFTLQESSNAHPLKPSKYMYLPHHLPDISWNRGVGLRLSS